MINYIELEKQLRDSIKELQDKIKKLELKRETLTQEKRDITNTIREEYTQLTILNTNKDNLLKHKYEFLINIISSIPSILVTLMPLIIYILITKNIELNFFDSLLHVISIIPYITIAGIIVGPISSNLFNIVKKRLLKNHYQNIINSDEYQELLHNIETVNNQRQENLRLEAKKTNDINTINDNIKEISIEISELRGFLNFTSSKNTDKEITLNIARTKKEGQ